MRTDTPATPKTIYLKDYAPPAFRVDDVHLTFQIFDGHTIVTNRMNIAPLSKGAPLVLNGEHLELVSVSVDGKAMDAPVHDDKTLTLSGIDAPCVIEIVTRITPEKNTRLEGLYCSGGTYCTQCEPEGFRTMTYYLDRSDVMTVFTVRIEADKKSCPVLLSNGNLMESGDLPEGRHFTVWHDPHKKPCYLFALVAGNLVKTADTFKTMSGRNVDLAIYTRAGDEGQVEHAMESLIKSMKWDEDTYGREYDLDLFNIVAVSDFNFGAMENKSLNIFNTALVLAHPDTATDLDFNNVEAVVGHEYFHNWTGNRITCRDWFQLTLKEGLTVFRDQEFSADMSGSHAVQRIDDVTQLRRLQFAEDASPLAHPIQPDSFIEINNFYTMTVYEKGAEIIRMYRTLMGHGTYRKATDLYFERHDGQAVTCEDFIRCMEDASGLDLKQFRNWYKYAGTPELNVTTHYDAAAKKYTMNFTQSVPDTPGQTGKPPFHIPVAIGLLNDNGAEIEPTRIVNVTEKTQVLTFDNIASKPIPSILRHFSAPVKLTTDLSDDDYRFLAVHDTDGFNRFEAGQILARRALHAAIDHAEQNGGTPAAPDAGLVGTLAALLDQCLDDGADNALLARMLTLPDIATLAQDRQNVDPACLHAARDTVQAKLADTKWDTLQQAYRRTRSDGPFAKDAAAMARRALSGVLLRLMTASRQNKDAAIGVAAAHYTNATTMTDRIAGLSCLAECNAPARADALADFYKRFEHHELAINKWFSVQAVANRTGVVADLQQLKKHPAFTLKNPNRARALFGAFAMNNPVAFHAADGSGYAFLADAVVELNGINPQVASRILTPMRDWKRYTKDRQEKIRAALERILQTPGISSDVFEIASKTLAG